VSTTAPKRLAFVNPDDYGSKLSVLLYGPPKTGKSTAAASMPGDILYVNSESPTALRFPRTKYGTGKIHEVRFAGKATFNEVALYLKDGGSEKTVVVDSIGNIYQALVEEIDPLGRITLPQRGDINTLILRFCRYLVLEAIQNVVLICHEDIGESGSERLLMPRTGGKQLPQPLAAMVDVIGYTKVVQDDKGQDHYVIQTQSDERHYAGNRDNVLGAAAYPDLTDWVKKYGALSKLKPSPKES
jgi:hypothetical protein